MSAPPSSQRKANLPSAPLFQRGERGNIENSRVTDEVVVQTYLDDLDRRIIRATQAGLPRVARPYHAVAEQVGASAAEVMQRLQRMLEAGLIRRIGAVPNHYRLGYQANGMTVWDVPDERVRELGGKIGTLDFVTHCYHRPRHPPLWPYNLFAMVHGRDRAEVEAKIAAIARLLGDADRGHAVLYSTHILKKTGLRLGPPTSNPPNPPFTKGGEGGFSQE